MMDVDVLFFGVYFVEIVEMRVVSSLETQRVFEEKIDKMENVRRGDFLFPNSLIAGWCQVSLKRFIPFH